jgi:hypothetical protein
MARKTIRVSDQSGNEIPDGKGATVRITFADARKGVRELDLTDAEAEWLGWKVVPARSVGGSADGTRSRGERFLDCHSRSEPGWIACSGPDPRGTPL